MRIFLLCAICFSSGALFVAQVIPKRLSTGPQYVFAYRPTHREVIRKGLPKADDNVYLAPVGTPEFNQQARSYGLTPKELAKEELEFLRYTRGMR